MKQYIVDAFTDTLFHGNQAAVCILDEWLPEDLMMNITRENNFSERLPALTSSSKNISLRKQVLRLPRLEVN